MSSSGWDQLSEEWGLSPLLSAILDRAILWRMGVGRSRFLPTLPQSSLVLLLCPQPATSWSVLKGSLRMSSAPSVKPLSCASNNISGIHPNWSPPMTGELGSLRLGLGSRFLFPCLSSKGSGKVITYVMLPPLATVLGSQWLSRKVC